MKIQFLIVLFFLSTFGAELSADVVNSNLGEGLQLTKGKRKRNQNQNYSVMYEADGVTFDKSTYFQSGAVTSIMTIVLYPIGGIGHFMQGRNGKGAFFLLNPIISLGGAIAGVALARAQKSDSELENSLDQVGYGFLGYFLTLTAIKIWENIDIWATPTLVEKRMNVAFTFKGIKTASDEKSQSEAAAIISLKLN